MAADFLHMLALGAANAAREGPAALAEWERKFSEQHGGRRHYSGSHLIFLSRSALNVRVRRW